ncbi:DUF6941 family protein [Nocardia gipuzkoensis]
MQLTVLLADSAQVDPAGKVHALGMGWSTIPSPTTPMSVILVSDLTEDEVLSADHRVIHVELCTSQGDLVVAQDTRGKARPVKVQIGVEVNKAAAESPGVNRFAAVANFGPGIPLPAGNYKWRVRIDGPGGIESATPFTVQDDSGKGADVDGESNA